MMLGIVEAWLPSAVALGALGLIWADIRRYKIYITKVLFKDDGQTIYIPRSACEREQTRCQQMTCGKIDSLGVKMDLMDTKREHAKEQQSREMLEISNKLAVLTTQVESLSAMADRRFTSAAEDSRADRVIRDYQR